MAWRSDRGRGRAGRRAGFHHPGDGRVHRSQKPRTRRRRVYEPGSAAMKYLCCDNERRRNAIKDSDIVNGIDFLEGSDDPNDPLDQRERTLFVHFIKPLSPDELNATNIRIEGGERIRNIQVLSAEIAPLASPLSPVDGFDVLVVEVNAAGDFSTYTLRL